MKNIKIIKDKAVLRRLIRLSGEISNAAYRGDEETDNILARAQQGIIEITQDRTSKGLVHVGSYINSSLEVLDKLAKKDNAITGIPTGFIGVDKRTAGLHSAELILIAARPGMGKTSFALNIAQYAALKASVPTAVFSLEMSKEQLVNRMLSMEARVDAQSIRSGDLQDGDWEKLIESATDIGRSGLIIDDTPGITIGELRSKCRKYKMEHDLKLVIIDYLQLMSGNGKTDSRQQEISEISRSLKGLARELSVPVIALSQVNRACETRPDHRPIMSDLRESGSIEQDADVIMFLYRDEYYNKDSEDNKGKAELIIAKQRNGPIGTVDLRWLPNTTRFVNPEK